MEGLILGVTASAVGCNPIMCNPIMCNPVSCRLGHAQADSIVKVYKSCKAFAFRDPHPDAVGRELKFKVSWLIMAMA